VFNNTEGDGRYARTTNWTGSWQPSKFDTAVINSGSVTVDAVGQHAGTLRVGQSGAATLRLTSGWIKSHQLTRVYNGGSIDFAGGSLDLTDGVAIFDYSSASPLSALTAQLASGRNGGAWNGSGISTSAAANLPGTGIGIAEASALGITLIDGESIDPTTVLLRYTWLGDANLDLTVDINDLATLASHWQSAGTWIDGDFDYSGFVDINDLAMLATNWQEADFLQALQAVGLAGIPEPTAFTLVASCVLLLRRRNRTASSR